MKAPRASAASPHDEHDGANSVERGAYSVERFAVAHDISRSQTFKEINEGRLPARKVGSRTIITREDAAKWRLKLPKATVNGAAKKPSDGLPAWLSEPRSSRRRAKPKTQGPIGSESDTTK
jgi:hypothetical protein